MNDAGIKNQNNKAIISMKNLYFTFVMPKVLKAD